ncbi:helix-turn-helix domain-containing protein [Streptacidiphilus neutrinimicus]|uniref:helix-turn-helix domain-containing protein n=1 Tax=Streptacidiphilus neutrinimicus TaxID=105420 RepID=UPI0005AAE987|nr:helix-turn-helix transcriptional regulator [Streptacidiphilus neutrinimicus]
MATHIEDFATLLRELKERSGRSYGQLAMRLHVSTSTLHRYCNGAAVPTDYAPVERLARLCGATPEELVTLHRRWLLADAARREPDRSVKAAADAVQVAEPEEGAAARAQAKVQEEAQLRPPAVPEAGETPEPPAAIQPVETVEAGASRRSRRPALVLGAVAAVAALPIALHSGGDGSARNAGATSPLALHGAPGAQGAKGASGAAAPTGPAVGTTTTATPPSQSASGGSGSPSAVGGSQGASATGGGGGDGQPLISVNVLANNWDMQCGQWFLTQQQPGKVPQPPSLDQTDAWASAFGGIPGGHLRLQLTVQSTTGQPVVLHALYVHVISSKSAPKGNAFTPGSGCGGGLDPASFAVNLDQPVPRTTPVAGYVGNGVTTRVTNFPYQVSTGDPQVLDVDASTAAQDVSWYLELSWSSGDRQGQLPITFQGRPFRTVGLQGDPAYFYDGTAWSHTSIEN